MSKLGNSEADCEDSFNSNVRTLRYAVADGASSSLFSDVWARAITETTVFGTQDFFTDPGKFIMNMIQKARLVWYEHINWQSLPWFHKNKAIAGSHSTLLGIQFQKEPSGYSYSTFAVGDTVLFKLQPDGTYESFPLSSPEQFNNTPSLVWSGKGHPIPVNVRMIPPKTVWASGTFNASQHLFIATDAVAKWLMEYGKFQEVRNLMYDKEKLRRYFTGEINSKRMRNDDLTLVILSLK
ncbi:MAG: protein phosphatase 2C domain-containing protein [Candidatus Thermoplasmatota archaeon]|nr:protein phosphatase 2C domain-containing protein [Candidatus Thermoplasmatota archaeon]